MPDLRAAAVAVALGLLIGIGARLRGEDRAAMATATGIALVAGAVTWLAASSDEALLAAVSLTLGGGTALASLLLPLRS